MSITVCDELGRSTRCYVSAFQGDRVHKSTICRGTVRCLVADFNGALPKARSISSVTWRCDQGFPVVMANARITGRMTAVDITAQAVGCSAFSCESTMDNGEVYIQRFVVEVQRQWRLGSDPSTFPQGPTVLTVSV